MKFVCSKNKLNEIVNIVQKAIGSKTALPILDCIKIEALTDGNIIFTSNSIEICIEYTDEMNVYESGSVALPSKIFGEIVRKMPEGDVHITVDPRNYITDIECEQSKFNIQGMNAEAFPQAPVVEENNKVTLYQKDLKQIIRKVSPFISQLESRKPVLTGALFDFKDGRLNVVGTDTHRLAVVRTDLKDFDNQFKFVVPGMTLVKIAQILEDEEEAVVNIVVCENHILFDFGKFQVYSRLLEGEFLKYEVILGATNSVKVKADKQAIINSLERANLIINDDLSSKTENKVPVKLNISYGKIDISCKTAKGYVNDSVIVDHDGGELTIGFNCRFMLDALNACDEDTVLMEFSAPTSGGFVKPQDGSDKFTYMVLPVRLYN